MKKIPINIISGFPGSGKTTAYSVTYLKEGYSSLEFSFPNLEWKLNGIRQTVIVELKL